MNNQHHPFRLDYNYCKTEKPENSYRHQNSVKPPISPQKEVPVKTVKPEAKQKADPEHKSALPSAYKKPQTAIPSLTVQKPLNHPHLNPAKLKSIVPSSSLSSPPPCEAVSDDQWWLEYDEYLSKILK